MNTRSVSFNMHADIIYLHVANDKGEQRVFARVGRFFGCHVLMRRLKKQDSVTIYFEQVS